MTQGDESVLDVTRLNDRDYAAKYGMCGGCGRDIAECCYGCERPTCDICPERIAEGWFE